MYYTMRVEKFNRAMQSNALIKQCTQIVSNFLLCIIHLIVFEQRENQPENKANKAKSNNNSCGTKTKKERFLTMNLYCLPFHSNHTKTFDHYYRTSTEIPKQQIEMIRGNYF